MLCASLVNAARWHASDHHLPETGLVTIIPINYHLKYFDDLFVLNGYVATSKVVF